MKWNIDKHFDSCRRNQHWWWSWRRWRWYSSELYDTLSVISCLSTNGCNVADVARQMSAWERSYTTFTSLWSVHHADWQVIIIAAYLTVVRVHIQNGLHNIYSVSEKRASIILHIPYTQVTWLPSQGSSVLRIFHRRRQFEWHHS